MYKRLVELFLKARGYFKLLCLLAVVIVFLIRTSVVNNPGYTKCSSMLDYGRWLEDGWSSTMCEMATFDSEREMRRCLDQEGVAVILIGGGHMSGMYDYLRELLTTDQKSRDSEAQGIPSKDVNGSVNITYFDDQHLRPEDIFQRLLKAGDSVSDKTAVFQECGGSALPTKSQTSDDGKSDFKLLLRKQKLFLKKHPHSVVVSVPLGSSACPEETRLLYSSAPIISLPALSTAGQVSSEPHRLKVLNLMLNTFCNEFQPLERSCCVAKRRSTSMNLVIGLLTLIIAFYTAMKMLLITDTLKGILPLMGVRFPKGQKGIGEYAHHPLLEIPNKLGALAMVIVYIIVVKMSYLFLNGEQVTALDGDDAHAPGRPLLGGADGPVVAGVLLLCALGSLQRQSEDEVEDSWLGERTVKEAQGLALLAIIITELFSSQFGSTLSYLVLRESMSLLLFFSSFESFVAFSDSQEWTTQRMSQVLLRVFLLPLVMWVVLYDSASLVFTILSFVLAYFGLVLCCAYLYPSAQIAKNGRPLSGGPSFRPAQLVPTMLGAFAVCGISSLVYAFCFHSEASDISNWEWNVFGDAMSVFYGIVVGVLVMVARDVNQLKQTFSQMNHWAVTGVGLVLAAATSAISVMFVNYHGNRFGYHWISYVLSPMLICSYILTRNAVSVLRNIHCGLLCHLGNMAYEVFLLYHCVFFSGVQKSVLVVFPGSASINVIVMLTTLLVVGACMRDVYASRTQPKTLNDEKSTRAQV